MKKKLIVAICSCFVMSMFMGSACFSNLMNKIKLVSDNVEALTKDYEMKVIAYEIVTTWPLGSKPSPESLQGQNPNTVVPRVIYSIEEGYSDYFYSFTPQPWGEWDELEQCDLSDYGYGWEGSNYCWLPLNSIYSLNLDKTTTVKKLR